jgi:predicted DNA-binding mobile mystery protein A
LHTLERIAEALDCRLVYALVPNRSLETTIRNQAKKRAEEITSPVVRTMALEKQATQENERDNLTDELADELIRKGGRALWKQD